MTTSVSVASSHEPSIDQRMDLINCSKHPKALPIDINAARLTKKEKRRLEMSSIGMTQKEQAEEESRTLTTIAKQCVSVIQKLGASNMTEAVAIALRNGLIMSLAFGVLTTTIGNNVTPRGPQRVAARTATRRIENFYS